MIINNYKKAYSAFPDSQLIVDSPEQMNSIKTLHSLINNTTILMAKTCHS
jgi:hypothetical protein